jgi:hypothetical protein
LRLGRSVIGVEYRPDHGTPTIESISRDGQDLAHLSPAHTAPIEGRRTRDRYDYLILAIPPVALRSLLLRNPEFQRQVFAGAPTAIRKLETNPMASVDLYLKRRIPGLPQEHVALLGSKYQLNFIDNGQLWPGSRATQLNVVASDFEPIADLPEGKAVEEIIHELARFVPFTYADIDYWHIQANVGAELFVNEVGSEQWRPQGPRGGVPAVFLAGDFCQTFIDVATIEGAVVSGLEAARAVQEQAKLDRGHERRADSAMWKPIEIMRPESYPQAWMAVLKLALAPHAYWAKLWSWTAERSRAAYQGAPGASLSIDGLVGAAASLLTAPYTYALEAWRSGASLLAGLGGASAPGSETAPAGWFDSVKSSDRSAHADGDRPRKRWPPPRKASRARGAVLVRAPRVRRRVAPPG